MFSSDCSEWHYGPWLPTSEESAQIYSGHHQMAVEKPNFWALLCSLTAVLEEPKAPWSLRE